MKGVTHVNLENKAPPKMMEDQVDLHVLGVIFKQYSFKAGLKQSGKEGDRAINKKLQQHHGMTMFVSIDGTKLSRKDRTSALGALTIVTQKRDDTVKARKCAGWRG